MVDTDLSRQTLEHSTGWGLFPNQVEGKLGKIGKTSELGKISKKKCEI